MRWVFALCGLAGLAIGQKLEVRSATAHAVVLEWTGTTGAVLVERAAAGDGKAQKIGTTDKGRFEDTSIDAFQTYQYRVVPAAGKPSEAVTVGPPPGGVSNVAPLPQDGDAVKYGPATAIGLDESGDPVIAFEWVDPNRDNDNSDSEIRFVRWSRAGYRWLPPVRVRVVGDIATQNLNPLAIACDRKSGLLAIGTPVADKGASILVSSDGGKTWRGSPIPGASGSVSSIAMSIVDGQIHLALASEAEPRYLHGPVQDLSMWKSETLPGSAGWKPPPNMNVALAMNPGGQPVIAWYEAKEEGDGRRFQVWTAGGQANTALETSVTPDNPDVSIAVGGGKIGLLIQTPLDEKDPEHGVWYLQSDDGGKTWSKPSKLPVDGPRSTNPPFSVAIDSRGKISAAFSANSGTDTTVCNYPVLSRSDDGVSWKTCGPGKAEGGDFAPEPATLHLLAGDEGKVYLLWQEVGENKFGQGVLLWHER